MTERYEVHITKRMKNGEEAIKLAQEAKRRGLVVRVMRLNLDGDDVKDCEEIEVPEESAGG